MSDLKTQVNDSSVEDFLAAVPNARRREDSGRVLDLMREVTGEPARMWGDSIVGFGTYHYRYKSGREGDWPRTGFSPRKQYLAIYIMPGFAEYETLLSRLGKHRTSVSCLYINKLADVDMDVLREIVAGSYREMARRYP
ncbi:MAG: DUF1801 domain-containing protein [Gammaproteobacteria bacterium]|nr:DUF1801 domain-containing protein [Gammaproteobacteria bacterium]MYB39574.1 DUF1801 domain-containing protein [Gammaproteobacteria bacterium]